MKKTLVGAIVAVAAVLSLSSCGTMPQHAETRIAMPAVVVVQGGPIGARVLIDNVDVGALAKKETRFSVASGTHDFRINMNGQELYNRQLFMQDGTQKVIYLGKQ